MLLLYYYYYQYQMLICYFQQLILIIFIILSSKMSQITVFLRHAKRSHNTQLDLSYKELSFIPKELFTMRNVQSLNLSHNKIEYIDISVTQLYKLKELDLSYNVLTEIPEEVSALPLLNQLRLEGNPLSQKFQHLLRPENQRNPQLANALRDCFERSEKTPQWLIQSDTKQEYSAISKDMPWADSPLRMEKTFSRRGQRRKLMNEKQQQFIEAESTFKNGVLQIKFNDLKIGQQISMGGFSTIHRGQYLGYEVAIKKVFNPNITQQLMAQFNNQITMLSKYRHPNIVLLMGAITTPPNLCIVMQYFKEGTLYDLLHRRKTNLSQQKKSAITYQILQAIQYLHNLGIVHRDIKSHNILLNGYLQVKLCDFGLAKHKSELNTGPMQYSGTPTYMAPQLHLKKAYDISVDIFALGTMLYEIYSGQVAYQGIDPSDIRDKVIKDSSLPHRINMKKSITEIINKCRHFQASMRPNIAQLIEFDGW